MEQHNNDSPPIDFNVYRPKPLLASTNNLKKTTEINQKPTEINQSGDDVNTNNTQKNVGDGIDHIEGGSGNNLGLYASATEMAQSHEATSIAIRLALEQEVIIIDNKDDAALRAIMRRGMCRMPVVVGIGPDGRLTSEAVPVTPTTATTTAADTSSQDQPPSHYHFSQDSGTTTPPS